MLKNFFGILILLLVFSACKNENKVEEEISKIPVSFEVERFEEEFAAVSPENLSGLKAEYPFLFPQRFPDSLWLQKKEDTIQQALNREVKKAYSNFEEEKESLTNLFQHLKFYFPEFKTPRVITITSEVDYTNKIVLADSLLLIALDNYLGEEHEFYTGIPAYIRADFREEQIVPDIAFKYAQQFVSENNSRSLLSKMIHYGKILYLSKKLLPSVSNEEIMSYTKEEWNWAQQNEEQVWRFFIENELLYDTNPGLDKRFINVAPFTKFGLQLDNQSPPQLGQYIGWQIVKQFADKNPEVSLQKLLQLDAETIFEESNYKPKRN
ncbi:gliding motility lipoprotein GldB [Mesonia maritima]|uniref:Gliding motility-associated lipoprotein GldB n=1 Tax=Mesonia maritima TaxID=1793873 RepID=A0ABU1KBY1_9FLAO|nr:gliding motility lipoprotein GldB [Mesonia maritima]MDR6302083.1 gliding motility-associated lipoprotein GldB [Mesonia maritima]